MLYPFIILAMDNPEDRAFMERLYDDYSGLMYKNAREILTEDQASVDDVVSDAIIALIEKVELIRTFECYTLRSYVVSTIRNVSLNHLKARGRRNRRFVLGDGDMLEKMISEEPDVDVDLLRHEEIERVKCAIKKLKESDRHILEMKYILDFPNVEIAKQLGISVDSVRPCLMRVRNRTYAILKEMMLCEE